MDKIEVTISNPEHVETMFEYLTRMQKVIPTYTQEDFLIVLNHLSYVIDSYKKTFLFDNEVDELRKQNTSLQSKLDEQIKVNEKLIKVLKKYADNNNWGVDRFSNKYKKWLRSENGFKLAKQTLKEIGEE